ncbi:unnamed protein product [Closterium sp. Naga37s-1]|nr:unnamed protein product [Closterium sp. Naga37s-1]
MEWSPGHVWSAQTVLPAGSRIEFKIIMVTENGDIVWQPGPNKTAVVSNAKVKQLLHLPWDNEDLPPLPRTADVGAVKAGAVALAPEFQEAELASGNPSLKGTKQAGQAPKKKPVSPTARVLQADAAWGQRVWGSLISSWGRQSLMDEETDRN